MFLLRLKEEISFVRCVHVCCIIPFKCNRVFVFDIGWEEIKSKINDSKTAYEDVPCLWPVLKENDL